MTFGEFIKQKRTNKNIKSKTMAQLLEISPAYYSSMETGTRQPPPTELLEKLAEALELTIEERYLLFDLAAKNKQPPAISEDLAAYIYQNPQILEILRYSMKCRLSKRDWEIISNFIYRIYKY